MTAAVSGTVLNAGLAHTRRPGFKLFAALIQDASGQIQAVWPNQCTGNQEPCDRRKPELMKDEDNGDRDGKDDKKIAEDTVISHSGHSQGWKRADTQ